MSNLEVNVNVNMHVNLHVNLNVNCHVCYTLVTNVTYAQRHGETLYALLLPLAGGRIKNTMPFLISEGNTR